MVKSIINLSEWQDKADDAVNTKKISKKQRYEFISKITEKKIALTQQEVQTMFDEMLKAGAAPKSTLNLGKWQSAVYQAVKSNKITEERGNLFMAKVREDKLKLKEEDVKTMFDDMVINSRSSQATSWKDITKQELPISGGPQCMRLIRKIDSGEIQTKEQFDKELTAEKADLAKQRESITKLKAQLKENVEKEKSILRVKCKNILVDVYFEDIEKKIDNLVLYGGMDILLNELIDGKSLEQVQKNVLDVYDKDIQKIKEYACKENDALDALNTIFDMLNKVDTDYAKQLILKIQNVIDQQGVMAAVELAKKETNKVKNEEQKDLKELKNDLVKAQKAAENDKEVIALSQLELEKIQRIADKSDSELQLDNYKSFRRWVTKGDNAFKVKINEFIEDVAIKSKKDGESVERILSKKCDDATWVMFADEKDYNDCCKDVDRTKFHMASSVFSVKDNPLVSNRRENVEILQDVSKVIANITIIKGEIKLPSGQVIDISSTT